MTRLARAIARDLDCDLMDLTEAVIATPFLIVGFVALLALIYMVTP